MPPTSLRVVERGRRLEVIDSRGGEPRRVASERPQEPGESVATGWLPRQVRFDGTKRWTTHRLYDDKAPRTVTLDPGRAAYAGWIPALLAFAAIVAVGIAALVPWALVAAMFLFNQKTRERLRAWSTQMIDRIEADNL